MPELPIEGEAVGFVRSFLRSGALKPLAIGAGVLGGAWAVGNAGGHLLDAFGHALHPSAQTGTIPNGTITPDGKPGADGYFFDPTTGRAYIFGAPPVAANGTDRTTAANLRTAIIAGAVVLALGVAAYALKGD
jgi:hypothetical protein